MSMASGYDGNGNRRSGDGGENDRSPSYAPMNKSEKYLL